MECYRNVWNCASGKYGKGYMWNNEVKEFGGI